MDHYNGSITKKGASGKSYEFKFGWVSFKHLSELTDLAKFNELKQDLAIRLVLFTGLMSRNQVNKLPDVFTPDDMYELLDDLTEKDVAEIWQLGYYSLGFTIRILNANQSDLQATAALNAQSN